MVKMTKKISAPEKGKSSLAKSFRRFKNTMTFFILIALSGFVFYTGWIQIRIPEGHYALIHSKTGGYDRTLLTAGQFTWRWENLFPTNMTIHLIQLSQQKERVSLKAQLPSGELYGEYIGHPGAFMYSVETVYRFSLKESAFHRLLDSGTYNADSLDRLYEEYRTLSNGLIAAYFREMETMPAGDLNTMEADLKQLIAEGDESFTIHDFSINSFSYPDRELYMKSRSLFMEELAILRDLETKAELKSIEIENTTVRKMDLLRQYGEVFSEYPVLLEYYGLERDKLDPSLLKETEEEAVSP